MKNTTLLLLIFASLLSFGQQTPNKDSKLEEKPFAETSKFNQKLADSLGADQRGMRNYVLVILKTGPKDKEITDKKQRDELFQGHFENITKMADEGKLIVAGPFGKNDINFRGLFIIKSQSVEESKALIEQDPTIKNGIFTYDIVPWYGSAALPMYLKYYNSITKVNK